MARPVARGSYVWNTSRITLSRLSATNVTNTGCIKQPSYAKVGTKKAELCVEHAQDEIVNVHNINRKTCAHSGSKWVHHAAVVLGDPVSCTRQAFAKHSEWGIINLVTSRCSE